MDVSDKDRKRRTVRMAIGLAACALIIYAAYIGYFVVSAGAS